MFRRGAGCCVFLLLVAGCTKDEDYYEVLREQRANLKEIADVLATVKDERSTAEAETAFAEKMQRFEAVAQRAKALPSPPAGGKEPLWGSRMGMRDAASPLARSNLARRCPDPRARCGVHAGRRQLVDVRRRRGVARPVGSDHLRPHVVRHQDQDVVAGLRGLERSGGGRRGSPAGGLGCEPAPPQDGRDRRECLARSGAHPDPHDKGERGPRGYRALAGSPEPLDPVDRATDNMSMLIIAGWP